MIIDQLKIRRDFPILHQKINGKPLVYLDNAATSQKPAAVIEAISTYYREYNSNIHRGVHTLAEKATQVYEGAREKVARFVSVQPSEIVFTRGTTESINLVAYSWGDQFLKAGDTILLTIMEHHSNLVPWQLLAARKKLNLEFIQVTEDGLLENPEETILRVKPKLLAFVHVSNVLGTINDVKKLVKLGHQVGATVLVDGAQAVPHLPVDVQSLGVDFYAFSGHKMLGPTGVGVLWGREELLNKMPPFQGGGEMIKEVYLRESKFKDPPHKFEAGTPSIAGVVGLGVAVDYLTQVGMAKVRDYEEDLTAYALEKLENLEGLTIYGPRSPAQRGGVVSFNVAGLHPHDLATILDEEGIAIRSGNQCAMPLHNRLGIVASARASFSLYNTKEEVDLLVGAINKAKEILA